MVLIQSVDSSFPLLHLFLERVDQTFQETPEKSAEYLFVIRGGLDQLNYLQVDLSLIIKKLCLSLQKFIENIICLGLEYKKWYAYKMCVLLMNGLTTDE